MILKRQTFFIHLLFAISFSTQSQTQVIKIWPKLAPGSEVLEDKEQWTEDKSVSNVYQPDLTICLPMHQTGLCPAMVIFPGGGYRKIDIKKEGYKIAKWVNENGIAAFLLKYRLNPNDALRDAQRAMSLIRKDAVKYKIDGNKIGVIGFSAGAHLACNLAVNYHNHECYDAIDTVSSRPDFWVGVYGGYEDIFSEDGKSEDSVNIPPTFLVHAGNDSKAPVIGSVELYIQLKKKGVPAELHIYEQGEHGFALEENRGAATTSTVLNWSKRLLEWLKVRGIQ
jgi:acetyl esterase/lipase